MNVARKRQLFTAIHRYLGLATMTFLLIAAITGCLLCIDTSIDAALNPDLFKTSTRGPLLSPTEAVARLEKARPALIVTQYPLRTKPGRTIKAIVAPAPGRSLGFDQLFLDPHDGRIAGTRQSGAGLDRRHIMDAVFSFHYSLLAGKWGRWLMGVMALGWLIGNLVGVYITLPVTKPFWRKWRRIWQIDLRARLRWLMLDMHRATGLWLLVGVSLLAFTSVAMNFYDEAFIPLTNAISPARPSPFDKPPLPAPPQPAARIGFGPALAAANRIAAERKLGWLPSVETYLPDRRLYGVAFTPSGYETYYGLGPVTYYLDAASGRFAYADDPYHDSNGRKLSRSLYPLHSGEVVGPIGTAIIFLLGITTAEMCVTGFYTWWKKRRSRLPRPASR